VTVSGQPLAVGPNLATNASESCTIRTICIDECTYRPSKQTLTNQQGGDARCNHLQGHHQSAVSATRGAAPWHREARLRSSASESVTAHVGLTDRFDLGGLPVVLAALVAAYIGTRVFRAVDERLGALLLHRRARSGRTSGFLLSSGSARFLKGSTR